MPQARINLEVYNKRNGTRGVIVAEGNDTVTINTDGVNKVVTEGTFRRWYTIIPQDKEEVENNSVEPASANEPDSDDVPTETKVISPSGEVGVGIELRNKFIDIVKNHANQSLDFTYDEKNNRDIIKYNGKNVFECTVARRRFNVLCHPKALTPDNLKRADKIYPKEWGWVLNVKFVFTDMSQVPLMRSVITDSLFYRQKEDK